MGESPILNTQSAVRSLWREYRLFRERTDFGALLGLKELPFDRIDRVEVSGSEVEGLLKVTFTSEDFVRRSNRPRRASPSLPSSIGAGDASTGARLPRMIQKRSKQPLKMP